jgi:hypothetical protein
MTLDEMLKFLQGCAQVGQPEFSRIEAALKAGQAMRAEVKYYYNDSTSGTRAWDAAVREDG